MSEQKLVNVDLTAEKLDFEMASMNDADLMKIKCFATHEGMNLNGTIFPREVLFNACHSFIDKPVILVPDRNNFPTGHSFDFKKKTFNTEKRINVGHIVGACPVIVFADGEICEVYSVEELNSEKYKNGELRIIADLVIYKNYLSEIADKLSLLHQIDNLSFSMEAMVSAIKNEDGSATCTSIAFTGLAIVDEPAFVNAKSIEVAEKEAQKMDFEKEYNELKTKYDELETKYNEVAEAQSKAEKAEANEELLSVKTELAEKTAELAEAQATIEALNVYKDKVVAEEKAKIADERVAKLAKFGVEKTAEEVAELSNEAFVDMMLEAADKYEPKAEVAEFNGVAFHNVGLDGNSITDLKKALEALNA